MTNTLAYCDTALFVALRSIITQPLKSMPGLSVIPLGTVYFLEFYLKKEATKTCLHYSDKHSSLLYYKINYGCIGLQRQAPRVKGISPNGRGHEGFIIFQVRLQD